MIAQHSHDARLEPRVNLLISLTIEADYRGRAAFPGLRLESCAKRSGTFLVFRVTPEFASEVLADAVNRIDEIGTGRGLFQAYRSLRNNLTADLDRADGVLADPGVDEFTAAAKAVGVLPVGAVVYDYDGEPVTITAPLALRPCRDENGAYRGKHGRFDYRPMYVGEVVRDGAKEPFVWGPGDLFGRDGEITHLRLVHSA